MMKKIIVNSTSSSGIAVGKACSIRKAVLIPDNRIISENNREDEISRYEKAVELAQNQINMLSKTSEIFNGHLMLIKDITLKISVLDKITEGMNAEQALSEVVKEYENVFTNTEDPYLKERSSDIKDIGNRILKAMKGDINEPFSDISEAVIIVAEELSPSDIPMIYANSNIKGIITQNGSLTSHASILIKNYGIPALIGVKDILSQVNQGDLIIMDAATGVIINNPEQEIYMEYMKKSVEHMQFENKHMKLSNTKAVTVDGRTIRLFINAGGIEEVKLANEYGTEGVGLLRSEIMFMQYNHFPSEEEQFAAYRTIAEVCNGVVIIRALDIGGDKELPYYKLSGETKPSLGWRGIRILLGNEEIFKPQLRAVLRASCHGNIKLLLPMITSIDEFVKAVSILEICKQELRNNNISFDENLEIGVMIETPAAILKIEEFAKLADFLSIGTNDLTQYILAADRENQKVADLYNSFHPAVIKSIDMVLRAGRKYNKKVGICGELAGDCRATKLLIGMGLEELSMSAVNIIKVKNIILNTQFKQAKQLAEKVLQASSNEEVMRLLSL
jgi:phosphotransferase system enzyme I (PtsI)